MQSVHPEYAKNSIESYLVKYTTSSRKIYRVVLLTAVTVIITLLCIYIDVSVRKQGIIRPLAETTEIKASVTEFTDSVYVKEGQIVNPVDTILTFRRRVPEYKIQYRQKRVNDFQEQLGDLRFLVKGERPMIFNSEMRRQEYRLYLQRRREYENRLFKAKKDLDQNRLLFEKQVISEEEYETYQSEYGRVANELDSLIDEQINRWQQDLYSYSDLYEEIQTLLNQEKQNKKNNISTFP